MKGVVPPGSGVVGEVFDDLVDGFASEHRREKCFGDDPERCPVVVDGCAGGTKVVIRTKKVGSKGSIQLSFFSLEDFDRILKVLKN